jgi:type I site-specific restriction endonuclease
VCGEWLDNLTLLCPRDYFGLVVIDEGHHASAHSYATVMEYFAGAMQVGTYTVRPHEPQDAKSWCCC